MFTKLRQEAETRLQTGTAPAKGSHALGQDALTLLHRLSSDPATAGDALKLLHELQVHQVELDLQIGQIEANEHELAEDLARFQTLYDYAPFAYFLVDRDGNIAEANRAGVELTGIDRNDLVGRRIGSFLRPESRPKLLALLNRPDTNTRAVEVVMDSAENTPRALLIEARLSPDAEGILLACCERPITGQN